MEEEEINENIDTNSPEKILNNKSNNIKSRDNLFKNSNSSSGELISKINEEANALNNEINSSNLKVFEKYHDLSIKELEILLAQKNDNILSLNSQKEKYKKTLSEIIKKLNYTMKTNSNYLYDDVDQDLILNLERIKEEKKRELEISKKTNKFFKEHLADIKDKLSFGDNEKKKMSSIEVKINNLKKKNLLIKKEINDIRADKLKHKKDYELVTDNKKFWHKIKIKTEEMNNFSAQKQGYFSKLNTSMKSLDNLIKELKRFEEIFNASINEEIEEILVKKINFWMNLIKKDLSGEKSEILSRIENGQSLFLKKISNNKNEIMERYSTNPTYNNINLKNNLETNNNSELKNKENENFLNNNIETTENIINQNNSLLNNNSNNIYSQEPQSKLFKNRIIINKNRSTSLILSNFNKGNNTAKISNNKIKFYMQNNGNINSTGNFNYNLEYKTLFRKLNYLKLKSPLGGSMKLKLSNINNLENYSKSNNNLISEEVFENNNSQEQNIKSHPNNNAGNNNELLLDNILTKDYNELSNKDYREILNKKDQYLQQNLRLEKNIEEIQRTKNKKLQNVLNVIEENYNNLENLKNRNDLLKKEIQNLTNVQLLRYEQAKLESEIQPKRPNIKKIKIKIEQNKSEEEINKIIELNRIKKKLKERKENKIDYFDEVFRKNKKPIKRKSSSKTKENNDDTKDREEKLKIIKEKYQKGGYDDSNDEIKDINNNINENEKLDSQIKENNVNNENNADNNINNLSQEEKKQNLEENKEEVKAENIN